MHYFKFLGYVFLIGVLGAVTAVAQDTVFACQEQGKKEFDARNYQGARQRLEKCLLMDETNVDTLLSLGGVALTQEDLPNARNYLLRALQYMKRTSPYLSYTYSMLGDIALKQQKNKEAMAYYNSSLSFNEANVNSLVGKAVVIEAGGDKKRAAEIYKTALAVEPLNLIARRRLIALEPIYFSDTELLEALKQRLAISPEKEALTEADRTLFAKIHAAEQRGGVGYLKEKYPTIPENYVVTLFKGTDFEREVLTSEGYQLFQKQLGQDAVRVFQKVGVPVLQVFDLRDKQGNKIFSADGTLTDSGLFVYQEVLRGRKAYWLPNEALPPTQAQLEKAAARIKELKEKKYTEISAKELAFVKKQTRCSEETLRRRMGLYILSVTPEEKRYFVPEGEMKDPLKGVPWYYAAFYRSSKDPSIKVPRNSLVERHAEWKQPFCSKEDGEYLY